MFHKAVDVLWLHRKGYFSDGAYYEGASYSGMSILPIVEMHLLTNASFGYFSDAMDDSALANYFPWCLDQIGTGSFRICLTDE